MNALIVFVAVAITCITSNVTAQQHSTQTHNHEDMLDDDDGWDFMNDDAIFAVSTPSQTCAELLGDHTKINDDYCDCEDGSDELQTAACSHLPHLRIDFECITDKQIIPTAFVHDGVCDCCDGSDELSTQACPNTCENKQIALHEKLNTRLGVIQRGLTLHSSYQANSPSKLRILQVQFEEIYKRLQNVDRDFQQLQQYAETLAKEQNQPSPALIQELQALYHQRQHWNYHAHLYYKLINNSTFSLSNGRDAFVELVGQCFPFTINEKQLRGGSSNVIPREYVIQFCPFHNVSQTEPSYPQWKRQERLAKRVIEAHDDKVESTVPQPVTMGVWDDWILPVVSSLDVTYQQYYNHGQPCGSDRKRVVKVDISCSDTNAVISVEELEICVYTLHFTTPAACTIGEATAIQSHLDQLIPKSPLSIHEEL